MLTTLVFAALVMGPPAQATDTIFAVERGWRLNVDNAQGEVAVRGWDRDAIRIRTDLSRRQRLDVVQSGSSVRVRPRNDRGGSQSADLEIDVPKWMDVEVEGNRVEVSVRGTEAEVVAQTVGGDILVEGGGGLLRLRSIQGEIEVRNARGRIEAVSVNEDISLSAVRGDIHVQTTNGDISMTGIRSVSARATTVNGDIGYDGTIADGGRYIFGTHNGDVIVTLPPDVSATVSVSTYHGEFESEFPVRLTGTTRDKQFRFTLGSGSAAIELESFNGEILLRRPR